MLKANAAPPARAPRPVVGLAACPWYVRFFRDPVACLREMHRRFGPVSAFGDPLGRRRKRVYAVALGPELNRIVYGDPVTFRTTGQTWPGPKGSALRRIRHGLTRMQKEKHRRHRRMLSPLFTKQAVDRYVPGFVEVTRAHLDGWPAGTSFDMWARLRALSLRISAHTLFGRETEANTQALGDNFRKLTGYTFGKGTFLFPFNLPRTPYRRMLETAERIEQGLYAMIERRRRMPEGEPDLLDRLIRARDEELGRMNDADLVGQSTILFNASFETTAAALMWTLFLLAQHPPVAADLVDEVDGHLHGEPPAPARLRGMPLLDAVIKESMRVLPPVPFQGRAVKVPAVDLGGMTVRKGDRVVVSSYITHHLPELYPEPERFLPERWQSMEPDQYEYLPFSAGPRYCIGAVFATMVMKVVVAMVLQRFRFSVVPGTRIDRRVAITMSPRHGLPMHVARRDGRFAAAPVTGDIHDMVTMA